MQVFARAENLRKSNNLIAAIDEYERAIALNGTDFRFPFAKGMCYMTLKDFDNAILSFESASKLKQDFIPAYVMAAKCYEAADRFVKVEQSLELAFTYETDNQKRIQYKETIIQMLMKQENIDKALKHVNDVKAVAPDAPDILYFEAVIYNKKGSYAAARDAMVNATNKLTTREPQRVAKYFYELGYAYNKLGEYEKASEAFKFANFGPYKALIAKLSPQYYTAAASAYIKINDFEKAKEMLNQALKMQKDFSYAYILYASIAKMEADQSEAVKMFQKALKTEPENQKIAKIYQSIAELQLDNNRFQEAINAADAYLKLDEKDYRIKFIQAIAHYKLKNYKQAIIVLENLVNYPGLDVESKSKFEFTLGIVYKEIKNIEQAKQAFKRAQVGSFKTVALMEEEELITETATAQANP